MRADEYACKFTTEKLGLDLPDGLVRAAPSPAAVCGIPLRPGGGLIGPTPPNPSALAALSHWAGIRVKARPLRFPELAGAA